MFDGCKHAKIRALRHQAQHMYCLYLAAGGYNRTNTSRCWTAITAQVLGMHISPDIPEHQVRGWTTEKDLGCNSQVLGIFLK